jgi:GT2 family glycosyltransferase
MVSVGVAILDMDQSETTFRCLESLESGTRLPDEIVLVENGETSLNEDRLEQIRSQTSLAILRPARNLGCAGGRNLALNYLYDNTSADQSLTLDNDIVVPDDFVQLVAELELSPMTVSAPVITSLNGRSIWSSGGKIGPNGELTQLTNEYDRDASPAAVDWAPGACLIFDRRTWNNVGGFDEWMDFLYEDVDWCRRVRDAGGHVFVDPGLRLRHEPHQSFGGEWSPTRVRYWARNGTVFRAETLDAGWAITSRWVLNEARLAVRDLIRGEPEYVQARLVGLFAGVQEAIDRSSPSR